MGGGEWFAFHAVHFIGITAAPPPYHQALCPGGWGPLP